MPCIIHFAYNFPSKVAAVFYGYLAARSVTCRPASQHSVPISTTLELPVASLLSVMKNSVNSHQTLVDFFLNTLPIEAC